MEDYSGEIWMRRRQKPAKRRFYQFIEHVVKHNRDLDVHTPGWIIKTHQVGQTNIETNFIKDTDIDAFRSKKRNIQLTEDDVAKLLLNGDIDAGIL